MLFNSYIFMLVFLPITLVIYFTLRNIEKHTWAKLWLITMSLWFYSYYNPSYLLVILSSIAVNYTCSYAMNRSRSEKKKRWVLLCGIVFNVGLIFYFKYFDFFIENINAVFGSNYALRNIVLPLGISFFTFQQISFIVDSYRGETTGYSLTDYMLFVTFFPQLIAGPIVLHSEIIPQFNNRTKFRVNYDNVAEGLYILAVGLFKKVLIADTFGRAVSYGYSSIASLSGLEAMIVMFSYTFQIYFDFSGYCDMARGIGLLLNIELPVNFNSPYKAKSIMEFWDRWHMTLTRFLRTYIYFPLGGNRKGKIRTYVNVMVVFLISGLWHGANWTFIVWGGLHGIANCLNKRFKNIWDKVNGILQWVATFLFVNFAWVFFRADSIRDAIMMFRRMLVGGFGISTTFANQIMIPEMLFLKQLPGFNMMFAKVPSVGLWFLLIVGLIGVLKFKNCNNLKITYTWRTVLMTGVLLVWTIVSFSEVSTFLYFGF